MQDIHLIDSRRIIFYPLLIVTIVTICGFVLLELYFNSVASERHEKDLLRLARSGAEMIDFLDAGADIAKIDSFADTFAENSRFRVTIIDFSGAVLGDSRLSISEIKSVENHADRPEIVTAKESGIGVSRRFSNTLKIDLHYIAVHFNTNGWEGYFRVALPLLDLEQEKLSRRFILSIFGTIALLLAAAISLMTSRYIAILMRQGQARLEQQVEKRTEEIKMLQNLGTQLTACNTKNEALEVIQLVASLLLPRFNGSLALFKSSRDKLEISADWNGDWMDETAYNPDQCWALRTGKPHTGNPETGNMKCNHSHIQKQQMLCIPLVAQGETHGVLHLASPSQIIWTPEEHQLAAALAEHASLTFASIDLRESLRQQAIRDALTGLYNRRYLIETMEHELSRAKRRKNNLAIIMLDLDHFKKFNDNHGHDVGDFILSEFGRLLRLIIRDEDIPCRYGGEEFTVLLPETDKNGAMVVAEKISIKLREHDFVFRNRPFGPITASGGIATFPENGQETEILFKTADEALYAAKAGGRNRIYHASVIPTTGEAQ